MDTRRVKVGVIGCGDIARRSYLPAIKALADRVELVATCATNLQHARRAAEEYGAKHWFADASEMLAQTDIDAVLVLTSMASHGPLSLAALEAGKHVYVEKVMAVTMPDAFRMVELAERRNLCLACAPSTILLAAFQHVSKVIASGEIGKVSLVHALGAHGGPGRSDRYSSDPTWFYQAGAGPLFDLAVYPVHILTQLFGSVRRVTAFSGLAVPEIIMSAPEVRGKTVTVEVDDTVPVILDFGDALFASVNASYNMLSTRLPAMQFWGSRGALTAPQFLGDEVGLWHLGEKEWDVIHVPPTLYDRLWVAAGLPHWLDCIHDGTQPVNSGRHGRHVLDVLLSAQESARTGTAVEVRTTL